MRKRKGIEEIAVMEMAQIGVVTRARALAVATASSATAKRRKAAGGELKFSPSLVQLRSRRENSVSPPTSANSKRRLTVVESLCSSASSGSVPASCCSSNGSSSLAKESLNSVDLKEESVEFERSTYNINRERRETTPSSELRAESDNMESTAKPTEDSSRRNSLPEKQKPSKSELEEFFAAAQKRQLKHFREKYNFDFEKEQPLEGRYEWVRLKP